MTRWKAESCHVTSYCSLWHSCPWSVEVTHAARWTQIVHVDIHAVSLCLWERLQKSQRRAQTQRTPRFKGDHFFTILINALVRLLKHATVRQGVLGVNKSISGDGAAFSARAQMCVEGSCWLCVAHAHVHVLSALTFCSRRCVEADWFLCFGCLHND